MGIFSNIKSKLKKRAKKEFIPFLMDNYNVDLSKVKSMLDDIIDGLIEEVDIETHEKIPPDYGNMLLKKEKTDASIKIMLDNKRNNGVRNDDIKWWWNMPPEDRLMLIISDNFYRSILFIKLREKGYAPQEAKCKVYKRFPNYGQSNSDTTLTGDDRPLPWELKDRINIWALNRRKNDNDQFEKDMDTSSSFNALIRKEIEEGKI